MLYSMISMKAALGAPFRVIRWDGKQLTLAGFSLRGVACAAKQAVRCAALLLLALVPLPPAMAQSNLPVPRSEENEFKDVDAPPLPAYPKAASLLRFPTTWSTSQVLVDTDTLTVHDDAVIRYTLVVKAAGGAENVTYEALRCGTGQLRVYAYGRRDGTWSPARNSRWREISDSGINRHHFEFWRDVFCDGKALERRSDILLNIKRGGRERPQSIPSD